MLLAITLFPIAAFAVNPDEVLQDPALETRARTISMELRCMVCQNQSIDDSNADLARDLRLLVRKRLVQGDSDQQVVDYLVSRYGEFVLLKPRFSERTWVLWGAPVGLFVVGGLALAVFARRRAGKPTGTPLTGDEQARLDQLLSESEPPSISPLVGEMSAAPTEGGGAANSEHAASPPSVTS